MACKIVIFSMCMFSLNLWGQRNLPLNDKNLGLDSITTATLEVMSEVNKFLPKRNVVQSKSTTHIGVGIASGFNNTRYLKVSKRLGFEGFPMGFYQSIEYATEYRYLGYEPTSPLFRMPFGISYRVSNKITVLAGTDLVTKIIYDYNGIRKDLGVCFDLAKTQITVGYSFVMGPSIMIGLPVF